MALALQVANLVRQKTYMSIRTPGVFYELKALFLHLASNKQNPDLQLVNIDGTVVSSDGGAADQVIANASCTLYAVYLFKDGTVATWFKLTDNATTGASNGSADFSTVVTAKGEEDLFTWPSGHQFVNGITIREDTTAIGSTRTLRANEIDGFVIIGAPNS